MNERTAKIVRIVGLIVFIATVTGAFPLGLIGILIGVYLIAFDRINPYLSRIADAVR
ncbi:hypothetical protein ACFQAS_06895 [Halopenitus salinus]|jgi:hypothetical protein|uniref:AI-2E family transporter n=1 Tax=Halopenitus salinus TaxID=1198295 RepID=A0ABD5V2D0_9EURY